MKFQFPTTCMLFKQYFKRLFLFISVLALFSTILFTSFFVFAQEDADLGGVTPRPPIPQDDDSGLDPVTGFSYSDLAITNPDVKDPNIENNSTNQNNSKATTNSLANLTTNSANSTNSVSNSASNSAIGGSDSSNNINSNINSTSNASNNSEKSQKNEDNATNDTINNTTNNSNSTLSATVLVFLVLSILAVIISGVISIVAYTKKLPFLQNALVGVLISTIFLLLSGIIYTVLSLL
jgi:hypothetical protein